VAVEVQAEAAEAPQGEHAVVVMLNLFDELKRRFRD
jgi:hypothetical protein